jgi:hypothetical protein
MNLPEAKVQQAHQSIDVPDQNTHMWIKLKLQSRQPGGHAALLCAPSSNSMYARRLASLVRSSALFLKTCSEPQEKKLWKKLQVFTKVYIP